MLLLQGYRARQVTKMKSWLFNGLALTTVFVLLVAVSALWSPRSGKSNTQAPASKTASATPSSGIEKDAATQATVGSLESSIPATTPATAAPQDAAFPKSKNSKSAK
jgi:predicted negative regulator of RcsB-dependent stress response